MSKWHNKLSGIDSMVRLQEEVKEKWSQRQTKAYIFFFFTFSVTGFALLFIYFPAAFQIVMSYFPLLLS